MIRHSAIVSSNDLYSPHIPSDVPKLNFPWFIYPGTPFAGYMSTEYIPELHRLELSLQSIGNASSKILFHLTIGSPMEEADLQTLKNHDCMFQMHQLLPDHLMRAAMNGITVVNFVVCPNVVDTPMFAAFGDYHMINKNKYIHMRHPITIHFFTTMMPTKDKHRNEQCMARFATKNFNTLIPGGIEIYRQTSIDLLYVEHFYGVLKRTVISIGLQGGFASCFSFAVFNDDTINRKFNNCTMFKEVLDCYPDTISSCIFEWIFRYCVHTVYNMHGSIGISASSYHPDSVSFVPPLILGKDTLEYTFHIIDPILDDSKNVKFIYHMMKRYQNEKISK